MKTCITLILCLAASAVRSQDIVNLVLVGKNGITENVKEATSFILVKKYPDRFQRLDYIMHGPLVKLKTYSDPDLKILEGGYYEYDANGAVQRSGYYSNNLKAKSWYTYNDTGKVVLEEKYELGILVKAINPDTVKKEEVTPNTIQKVEKEASFQNGDKDWIKYLRTNLKADVALNSVKGGTVRVIFVVSKTGKCTDVYLKKSVEFVLDEEAIRVIENSPLWNPAIQNDRIVNAYRVQPLTFIKE